jgi:Domain of unknown function (DUF5664)
MDNKESALRYSEGKAMIHLIPPDVIVALAQQYTKGAKKYAERNWEKGMDWHECYNSLMRHALSWNNGEDFDVDDKTQEKTHHMIAVMWNAAALYWYFLHNKGTDTRPKYEKDEEFIHTPWGLMNDA